MEFKIPTSYHVGGQKMNVEYVDRIDNTESLGDCCVAASRIRIANNFNGMQQSESSKTNTFFHELVHSILGTMGAEDLNHDEKFVCTFSGFLTEAILSSEQQ